MEDRSDTQLLDEISQQFLRAVRLTFGPEKVSEVIAALEGSLGKSWKDRAILHKLAGLYQITGRISIRLVDEDAYRGSGSSFGFKIRAIKVLRSITNFGLIESKRAVEGAEIATQVIEIDHFSSEEPAEREQRILASINVLRQCGFEVNYA